VLRAKGKEQRAKGGKLMLHALRCKSYALIFLYIWGTTSLAQESQSAQEKIQETRREIQDVKHETRTGTEAYPYSLESGILGLPLSLFEKSEKIAGKDLKKPHQLIHWPIIPGTDRVWIDGMLKSRDVDYIIDYNLGQVSIKQEIAPESVIRIDYQVIPISIQRFYQRQLFAPMGKIPHTPGKDAETLAPKREEIRPDEIPQLKPVRAEELPSTLNFSGTKTLSLSMESIRGLTINQPTRLNVSGKVSEDVSVMAMLSDQDLPLQPEGTTEELEELDRIVRPDIQSITPKFEVKEKSE